MRDDTELIARVDGLYDGPASSGDLLDLMARSPAWHADAACREPHPGVTWFPGPGQSAEKAMKVCRRCLVRAECLEWALDQGSALVGIWGATSERRRRQLRRDQAA